MTDTSVCTEVLGASTTWRDYWALCKPRVVALMMLTTLVGMCLASSGMIPWPVLIFGNLGIALSAGAAAVINHVVDSHIDRLMQRTKRRPIVQGKVSPRNALIFSVTLCVISMFLLVNFVNPLTAFLTFLTIIGYAGLYSLYLKHATPQNIVIGGVAGAAPPMLGWVAVTGQIDPQALLLMLIIFVWTPPHFWALAIHRVKDYAKAKVPMLPNTHGVPFTKLSIVLYTALLCAVTLLPFVIGMSHEIYLIGIVALNARFAYWVIRLWLSRDVSVPMKTFRFSIVYLMLLFVVLLVDHYFYLN